MFNNRKYQLLAFILDLSLFVLIFPLDYKNYDFLNLIQFGIWIAISYILGKYNFTETKLIDILERQFTGSILCLFFILFINNGINLIIKDFFLINFRDLIKLISYSFIINSFLNLYFNPHKEFNEKWVFLGSQNRFKLLQENLKKCNEKINVYLFSKIEFYNLKNNYSLVIDHNNDELQNLSISQDLSHLKKYKLDDWLEKILKRYPSDLISDNLSIKLKNSRIINSFEYKLKTLIEKFVALVLLILFLPIISFTLIIVFLEDRHNPFFLQERTGINNRKINIIKIRTMRYNVSKDNLDWAKNNDPRITRVGSLIRKIRIDELPQLYSVISGDISLIGPRPERPEIDLMLSKEIKNYRLRYDIKPGLSGWAQVNYPYGASVKDSHNKLSYDLFYIKNFSLLLDLIIFFKTIRLVVNGRGSKPIS